MDVFDAKLPEYLRLRLERSFSEEDCARIAGGYASARRSAFRLNRLRCGEGTLAEISAKGIGFRPLEWFPDGFVCSEGDDRLLRETAAYENGEIYLQNPSSMLPPVMLGDCAGLDVLDMCAAPGGKTTQLASMSLGRCGIMACEQDRNRAEKLKYNLQRQGARAAVQVGDARKLDSFFRFDRILLDAPCSGSGTVLLSRDATYRAFSEKLVKNCAKLQLQLLKKAVSMLKKGGELVYSTCSVLPEEDEEVAGRILAEGGVVTAPLDGAFADVPRLPCGMENAMLVCPNDKYEGFFAVKFIKASNI